MTTLPLYLTSHPVCLWLQNHNIYEHNHYICDITPTLFVTSHPQHWTSLPLYMTSHTKHMLSYPLHITSWPVKLWYPTNYIYGITQTVLMTKHPLYVILHPLCLGFHPLYVTSHPLCLWHHIHSIWHHTHYVYENRTSLSNITSTVSLSSHPLNRWYHTHCTYDITATYIWHHMQYTCHNIHSLWNHSCVYDFISTLFMTSDPLYMWITAIIRVSSQQLFYDIIFIMSDITHNVCMTTQPLYLASHPLYLTSHRLYLCHHTHCINDISPLYSWHHTLVYDITSTDYDITSTIYVTATVTVTSLPWCL